MNSTQKKLAVMNAYVAGELIQLKGGSLTDWADWKNAWEPEWDWRSFSYRVKPKPREFVMDMSLVARGSDPFSATVTPCFPCHVMHGERIRVREIID